MDASATVVQALASGDMVAVINGIDWDEREDFLIPEMPSMMGMPTIPGKTVTLARLGAAVVRYWPENAQDSNPDGGLWIHAHDDVETATACYGRGVTAYRRQAAEMAADPAGTMIKMLMEAMSGVINPPDGPQAPIQTAQTPQGVRMVDAGDDGLTGGFYL